MGIKKKLEKRSPLKAPPLRQAGQSVDEEIQRILEKISDYLIKMGVLVGLVSMEWSRYLFDAPPNPILLSALFGTVSIYWFRKAFLLKKTLKNLKLARDGERAVGEFLDHLKGKGYRTFHDIIGGDFNIDHLIIGKSGVFTIETKTISKPVKGPTKIDYDGEKISINGFIPERDPIIQAKAQAGWIKELLSDILGKKIRVRPVVVYPGWFISPLPKGAEVWVLNPKALPVFLENENVVLNAQEVQSIAYHLSRYVRNSPIKDR